ncbi:MAG: hypothetical protein C4562_02380 [Actinobacteria bacterium]|nr:MAG: hypothetical protein C4562_02380 [Actinomycetota bacterium]
MEHFGLVIAVIGPFLLILNLITAPLFFFYRFGVKNKDFLLIIGLLISAIAFGLLLISFPSISSITLFLLCFTMPQLIAFRYSQNKRSYWFVLIATIITGLIIFILLGVMFGKGNID